MNEILTDFLNKFSFSVQKPNTISIYRKGVYLFILLFTLLQISVAKELWSESALLPVKFFDDSPFLELLNLLSHQQFAPYYLVFVLGLIFCCLLSFFVKKQQALAVLIYFLSANLYHRTITIQNGGGDLLMLQLFFLMGMNEIVDSGREGHIKTISIALTNVAFFASQIQLILVYVVSGVYKLKGQHWIDGSALHYVLLNEEYSLIYIKNYVFRIPFILKIATWFVLIFQLLFPVLIWIKKMKPVLLFIGIVIHLMIAFVMGIMDFGILMIVMYLLFCNEKWSADFVFKIKSLQLKMGKKQSSA